MKNNIYVLFNNLTLRYEGTFESPTDASASVNLLRSLGNHPDYEHYELCRVAQIDIELGVVTPEQVPVRVQKQNIVVTEKPIDDIENQMKKD